MIKIARSYWDAFLFIIAIMMTGFILQYASTSESLSVPSFPVNLFILLAFVGYLIFTYSLFSDKRVIAWITSIPVTIAVISVYTLLTLMMGFIAQEPQNHFIDRIGLTNIKGSYPFLMVTILFLMILGYTIIKRLKNWSSLKNIAFLLNHAGLFIIIAAASIGTGDLVRISMPIEIGTRTDIAFDRQNQPVKLPFQIELKEFHIDEYPPELVIFNRKTNSSVMPAGGKFPSIEEGKSGSLESFQFEILEYHTYSKPEHAKFVPSDTFGSVHSAKVWVSDSSSDKLGWISTGNFMHEPKYLLFDDTYLVAMSEPKVLKYRSRISIHEDSETKASGILIEVNKPYRFNSWKIYQNSYDARQGRWSEISVFELVKDPWLPVVYAGIFMLLLGSVYLIYAGRPTNE
ncbi:MAG: cytochrome c biogenesis protein ResB [Cyclonatronaceae bacterium]